MKPLLALRVVKRADANDRPRGGASGWADVWKTDDLEFQPGVVMFGTPVRILAAEAVGEREPQDGGADDDGGECEEILHGIFLPRGSLTQNARKQMAWHRDCASWLLNALRRRRFNQQAPKRGERHRQAPCMLLSVMRGLGRQPAVGAARRGPFSFDLSHVVFAKPLRTFARHALVAGASAALAHALAALQALVSLAWGRGGAAAGLVGGAAGKRGKRRDNSDNQIS